MLAAACAPASSGGSAGQPGAAAPSAEPVTIRFFKRGTETEDLWARALAEWNQKHPTWTVELTQGVPDAKLPTYTAAGEKMDALGWFQSARTLIIQLNLPRSLDDYIKRDKYPLQQFSPKELDLVGRYQGKVFALPYAYGGNNTAVFFNRSLFQQAGVPEPPADWEKAWTWDQFRDVVRRLTKKTGSTTTQVAMNDMGTPSTSVFVLSDATWVSDDYTKATADKPETIDTVQKWAEVVLKDGGVKYSPSVDLGAGDTFIAGKEAMHTISGGPDSYSNKLDASMDWGFAPTPKIKYASPDFQSVIIMAPSSGDHPAHSWELIKYLIENNRFGGVQRRVPAVLEDAAKWAKETYKDKPNVRPTIISDGTKIARPVDKIKYHPYSSELYDVVNPALTSIWQGKSTAAQALKDIQAPLQAIVDRAPAK
jgi:multiple sugar transport system substrate-binding protein